MAEIMDVGSFQTLLDRRYREIYDEQMASTVDQLPMFFVSHSTQMRIVHTIVNFGT